MSVNSIELVEKRIATLDYIVRVHTGSLPWLNTTKIGKSEFANIYNESSKLQPSNAYYNFFLGSSVSMLAARYTSLPDLLKALTGVFKDYENLKKSTADPTATRKMAMVGKRLFRQRKESQSGDKMTGAQDRRRSGGSWSTLSNSTEKVASSPEVDLHYLVVYHLPFMPDVYQTFVSLCESLLNCYRLILHYLEEEDNNQGLKSEVFEILLKFDNRVNKNIVAPTIKDIDSLGKGLAYEDTSKLNRMLIRA